MLHSQCCICCVSITEDDHYYLQIADQTGKPLDLPREERKVLQTSYIVYMTE